MTASNSAEGQTSGTILTVPLSGGASGTAFAVVSAGTTNTITFDSGSAWHGSNGYLFTKGSTNASVAELRDGTGSADWATQIWYKLGSYPSTTATQMGVQLRNTADVQQGGWRLTPTGLLIMQNGAGTTIATGTVPVGLSVYNRYEFTISAANVWTVAAFTGDSATPIDSISGTGSISGTIDRSRAGNSAAGTISTYSADDFQVISGQNTFIGVLGPGPYVIRTRRVQAPRRARTEVVQPPPPDLAPPSARGPRRQFRPVRRGVEVIVPPPQVVVSPVQVAQPPRVRRFAAVARRRPAAGPVQVQAVVPPAFVPAAVRGRRVGRWLRRSAEVTVVPTQVVVPVNPPIAPPGPRVRRAAALLRRRPPANPVPVQVAAPVNPPIVVAGPRVRRALAVLRRRPAGVPVPQQVAPVAPQSVPAGPRLRRLAGLVKRPRVTTNLAVIPDQAAPALPASARRRPAPPIDRRRGAVPVVQQPAPVAAPRPVRRRLLGLFRRGPGRRAFPVQPGNPNVTIPRPGTVEPGTRGGPAAGAGARGGPGVGAGTRQSVSGVPGAARGGDNEPGTRSGPTITGGQ